MNRSDHQVETHDPRACPDADAMIAYHAGELAPEESERLQEHLLTCPESRLLLLNLEGLRSGELGSDREVSELETAAAWKSLRSRIAAQPGTMPSGTARPPRWLGALAASLAVVTLGLALWVAELHRHLAEATRPQLDAVVRDLFPDSERGGDAVLRLGPGDRLFTLVLHPDRQDLTREYAVTVLRGDGEPVWRDSGLSRNELGSLVLTLSRRQFGDGDYRIHLSRADDPRGEPVAEFTLAVESAMNEDGF